MHRLQLLLLKRYLFFLLFLVVLVVGWKNLFYTVFVDINYLVLWLDLIRLLIRFKVYYLSSLRLGWTFADQDRYVLLGFLRVL
jgi:hypothetical protein